jgi:hypothetical protein
MADTKNHSGGCHCGRVRFEAEADLDRVITCNCSICTKRGSILAAVTPDKFKLLKGEDSLTDYQFNRHIIHHLFCSVCGTQSFARGTTPDGTAMVAINVRCLDDVDVEKLAPMQFDGKSL